MTHYGPHVAQISEVIQFLQVLAAWSAQFFDLYQTAIKSKSLQDAKSGHNSKFFVLRKLNI